MMMKLAEILRLYLKQYLRLATLHIDKFQQEE